VKRLTIRHLSAGIGRCLGDDRGVAATEGLLVFLELAAVLLGVMLLGQWGIRLQYAQMGARLLTFNSGDLNLARFNRPGNQAETTFSRDSVTWSSYDAFDALPTSWFNTLFVLPNDYRSGRVKGTQRGRLAQEHGSSLFDFSLATLGYHSRSSAACNPWTGSEEDFRSKFLTITYHVGRLRVQPQALDSVPPIPTSIPLLEAIYTRVGGIR
jgi:hypothetical protein